MLHSKRVPQSAEPTVLRIPAGEFLMGSDPQKDENARPGEQPQHVLALPAYDIAIFPVTNRQYQSFLRATGYPQPINWSNGESPIGPDHPVTFVTHHDATVYCHWLSKITGRSYRLPSEAEWEKGARGTDGRIYPWGNRWKAESCNAGPGVKRATVR
jgi:formylglycine-generating enzyme required for sulfatase activity